MAVVKIAFHLLSAFSISLACFTVDTSTLEELEEGEEEEDDGDDEEEDEEEEETVEKKENRKNEDGNKATEHKSQNDKEVVAKKATNFAEDLSLVDEMIGEQSERSANGKSASLSASSGSSNSSGSSSLTSSAVTETTNSAAERIRCEMGTRRPRTSLPSARLFVYPPRRLLSIGRKMSAPPVNTDVFGRNFGSKVNCIAEVNETLC